MRSAFVAAYAEREPARAAALWPGHPAVVLGAGLAGIGEAAAAGQPITAERTAPLIEAARDAPLAPEPFLVRGVQLRLAGDEAAAGRAFAEARRRDPRSVPARFFLADHHLRGGQRRAGLEEVAALARLVPGSEARLAPILAGYVVTPGAVSDVRALLRAHPRLEPDLLNLLTRDPRNADLVLSLASTSRSPGADRPAWQSRLIASLVDSGQYDRAYKTWARLMGRPAGAGDRPLLFDPRVEQPYALRPFGWTLKSSAAGLVEPEKAGLHVLYYGRDNVALASQTLLLPPGGYTLSMTVTDADESAASVTWTINCLPSKKAILTVDLAAAAKARGRGLPFDVPASGCAAQRLELLGKAPDFPETVDLSVSKLNLSRRAR